MIVLCSLGYLLVLVRDTIQGTNKRIELQNSTIPVPGYVNAIFAGVLLETVFLASAHALITSMQLMQIYAEYMHCCLTL